MWNQIKKNEIKVKTALTVMFLLFSTMGCIAGFVFGAFLRCILGYIDIIDFSSVISSIAIGWLVSTTIFVVLCIYLKNNGGFFLGKMDVYKCDIKTDYILHNIVSEVAIAAGLTKHPYVYIVDSDVPNSFAVGDSSNRASIYITKKMLEILNRDELQGVIAHELSHIINHDYAYLTAANMIVFLFDCRACLYSKFYLFTIALFLFLGILLYCLVYNVSSFLAPITPMEAFYFSSPFFLIAAAFVVPAIVYLIYLYFTKNKEYLADAYAVQYTRYPLALASALKKIYNYIFRCVSLSKQDESDFIFAALYDLKSENSDILFNDISGNLIMPKKPIYSNEFLDVMIIVPIDIKKEDYGIFSTHPHTLNRIKILSEMMSADILSYNNAYKTLKNGRNIIDATDLANCKKIQIKDTLKADNFNKTIPLIFMLNAVNNVQADGTCSINKNEIKKCLDNSIEQKLYAQNLITKLKEYIFINCSCGTILKVPPCYKGIEIICPHCKSVHLIKNKQ